MTVIAEGFPTLTWEQACEAMHDPAQKPLKAEILAAIDVFEQKQAGKVINFSPAAECSSIQSHITGTYFEVAFFTEADILRLTSCAPATLGLKTKATITIEDGSTLSGFFISMRGLPADEIAACRKVKIETRFQTTLNEHILQAGQQIRAQQGMEIYQLMSDQLSQHQNWVKPSARKNLHSHAGIMEKANSILKDILGTPMTLSGAHGVSSIIL